MSEVQTLKNGNDKLTQPAITPAVDVIEDATGITLFADIPGVSRDKLNLSVEQDTLVIEGQIDISKAVGAETRHAEIDVPHYRRAFTLSKELDPEKISAQLTNGVLKLHIPKAEHAQPKRINVTIN